jgi:hypothetical protein
VRPCGNKRGQRYLHQVLHAVALAGGIRHTGASPRQPYRSGRWRRAFARGRYAGYRQRRVIIKYRIVKLAGHGMKGALVHLRYIQRDGVTRDGQPGQLYSADQDQADGKAFLERSDGDRHQFRFIVSAKDGVEYDDLKPFAAAMGPGSSLHDPEEKFGLSRVGDRSAPITAGPGQSGGSPKRTPGRRAAFGQFQTRLTIPARQPH